MERPATMDRDLQPRRRPSPPVLELLEPPRGLGFDIPELEELILAVDDRLDYGSADSRVVLRRVRAALELELGRIIAAL